MSSCANVDTEVVNDAVTIANLKTEIGTAVEKLSFASELSIDSERGVIAFNVENEVAEIDLSEIKLSTGNCTVTSSDGIALSKLTLNDGLNTYTLNATSGTITVTYTLKITRKSASAVDPTADPTTDPTVDPTTDPEPAHTHTYAEVWSKDADYHWHAATCAHTAEVKDKAAHTWNEGQITTPATIDAEGVKTFTCTVCGATKTEPIDRLPHTHKYGEWTTHIHATCIAKGEERRYCECGFYQNREIEIDPNAHDLIHHEGKEKTCTENGWKEYDCSRCDYSTYSVILAAHDYGKPAVVSAPTCTSGGMEVLTCVVCGNNVRRSLDALGHSYADWETTKQPICEESGERERICTRCGDAEKETLAALGHKFGDWEITKQATCITGEKERVCSVCSYIEKADIPADFTAHVFKDGICSICGEHTATDGLLFEMLTDTTVAVSGYTGTSTVVHIPSSFYGSIVTEIKADAFKDKTTITEITVPNSVTMIGSAAFRGCSSLTSITIPFVGGSKSATYASRPTLFGYIFGTSSYTGGTAVNQYYESSYYGYATYYIPSTLRSVTVTGGNVLYGAFYNCSMLTSVTIGEDVTSIGNFAFRGCSGLTSITIPDGVTSIEQGAFSGCRGLISITIPFVGAAKNGTSNTHFGYIFGAVSYSYNTNSVPSSLKSVVITGDTSIGDYAFYKCSGLTSITIPNSVTSIGDRAFSDCSGLTSIYYMGDMAGWCSISGADSGLMKSSRTLYINGTKVEGDLIIPEGVTSIGSYAFQGRSGLTSVTIPDGVTSIGDRAFYNCSGLTSIYYTGDVAGWCGIAGLNNLMRDGSSTKSLYISGAEVKGDLVIPSGVTTIPSSAFCKCSGLTSITIPDGVTSIGEYAFYNCNGLTSITIPDGVTSIGSSAFWDCSGLTSITIPDGVTSIGEYAFRYCRGLTSIYYMGDVAGWCGIAGLYNLMSYGSSTKSLYISGAKVDDLVIPDGVTSIGPFAFAYCRGLTSITIPKSVTSIGSSAFFVCSGLTSITIPFVGAAKNGTSCTHFGYIFGAGSYSGNASYVPSSLKSVVITGDTSIGEYAFYNCSGLTSITIPDGVTSIGSYAFDGCSGLTSIYYTGDVAGWCGIAGLYNLMSDGSSTKSLYISGAKVKGDLVIPSGVTTIPSSAFCKCSGLTSITIPDSVTSIGSSAFSGCGYLTSIYYTGDVAGWCGIAGLNNLMSWNTSLYISGAKVKGDLVIPDGVTSIGEYAFYYCRGLTSITIPDGVTSIGSYAFQGCSSLTSVTFAEGSQLTSIGNAAFYNCSGLTTITIPDSVTNIGDYAFTYCSGLTTITIQDSVTSIGDYAFTYCSGLTSITYQGTKAQWSAISKGSHWNDNTGNYTIRCTDGNISK